MIARLRQLLDEEYEGFTLIELLVVIIIIGILAAIAIPVFLNQRKKGYDAQAKGDLRTLATMQETYLNDNGTYATLAQLVTAGFKRSPNSGAVSTVVKWRASDAANTPTISQPAATGGFVLCTTADSGSTWVYDSLGAGLRGTPPICPAT